MNQDDQSQENHWLDTSRLNQSMKYIAGNLYSEYESFGFYINAY